MRPLPADHPDLLTALETALTGGAPLAPLPPDPTATLAMLQPELPVTEEDAALIVGTSGSTGTPKGVVLSSTAIRAGVEATQQRLGGPGRWTLALPAHYVAGIMVVARALIAGTPLATARADLTDLPEPHPTLPDYLSIVPTQLIRALREPAIVARLAGYDAILLGGAAPDPGILQTARDAGLRIVTTYGMSETCGGCVYDGLPLAGVEVGVEVANTDNMGRVCISGPVVFSGYRLRPDLGAGVLTEERGVRTFHTADRGQWAGERLQVLGRVDDVVISGGVNVDLATVERELRRLDPQAVALGVPDPEWGTRVLAALTVPLTLSEVRDRLPALDRPALPRGLLRLDPLPMTTSGKVDRQRLKALWAQSHENPGTTSAGDPIVEVI